MRWSMESKSIRTSGGFGGVLLSFESAFLASSDFASGPFSSSLSGAKGEGSSCSAQRHKDCWWCVADTRHVEPGSRQSTVWCSRRSTDTFRSRSHCAYSASLMPSVIWVLFPVIERIDENRPQMILQDLVVGDPFTVGRPGRAQITERRLKCVGVDLHRAFFSQRRDTRRSDDCRCKRFSCCRATKWAHRSTPACRRARFLLRR